LKVNENKVEDIKVKNQRLEAGNRLKAYYYTEVDEDIKRKYNDNIFNKKKTLEE